MANRTLNRVMLIGNIVQKPLLQQTGGGVSVTTFHVITDRYWTVEEEQKKESTKHVCVAWHKLAEICADILDKGDLVYIDGRLSNKLFVDSEGVEKDQVEIIVDNMSLLNDFDKTIRDEA